MLMVIFLLDGYLLDFFYRLRVVGDYYDTFAYSTACEVKEKDLISLINQVSTF